MTHSPHQGRLIGVSLGPGDPGLITRRAWEVLHSGAHWAYPVRAARAESYALGITRLAGLTPPAEASALIFPMTHDIEKLSRHWLAAAQSLLPILERGRDVAFLVEGDASTYSTFGHLARTVTALAPTIEVETIAGVASFLAGAARTGVPLGDTDDTIAILPAGYGVATLDRLLEDFDTLVLLKVKPLLDEIIDWLEQRQLLEHALFIERAGSPEERVVRWLPTLRGEEVNYLSLLLLRHPHRQRPPLVRGCRPRRGAPTP